MRRVAGALTASALRRLAPGRAVAPVRSTPTAGLMGSTWSDSNLLMPTNARRFITLDTVETPNPNCRRFFNLDVCFMEQGTSVDFPTEGHAYKSKLAQRIFEDISGIDGLYFADDYITVTKTADAQWNDIIPRVSEVVTSFHESGDPLLTPEGESEVAVEDDDTRAQAGDDEVVLAVKELLSTRIRPMLRGDGGNCRYIGISEGGVVYLMLEGACRTCPSSGYTLKNGIERMLMHWIPEVTEVEEVNEQFALEWKREHSVDAAPGKGEDGAEK